MSGGTQKSVRPPRQGTPSPRPSNFPRGVATRWRLWVRAAWQNFSIGVGGQVRTVRERRSNRDAMAAPRAAWESVGRARKCGGVRRVGAGGNRYAVQRSRRWMSRADVGWDPKICSTTPPGNPIPSSIKFPPWGGHAVETMGAGGVAEFFHRRGRAGADGEGAAVEQRCDGGPASGVGIGRPCNGNAAAFGGRCRWESVREYNARDYG